MQEQRHRKLYYVHTHGLHYAQKRPHIPMKSIIHGRPGVFNKTPAAGRVQQPAATCVISSSIPGPVFACSTVQSAALAQRVHVPHNSCQLPLASKYILVACLDARIQA
jgi:hypothetical protein